jgi:molybdate transport system regulatory protein
MELSSNLTLEILNQPFLLEKRIKLLEAIEIHGSILKAAKNVPMSYKSAWDSIDAMNNLSPYTIVNRSTGGKNGGGTSLTEYGKKIVETYKILQIEQKQFLRSLSQKINFDDLQLDSIRRLSMNVSARNQISGTIEQIKRGGVNASIFIKLKSAYILVSIITNESVDALELNIGDRVTSIFKSSSVLLSTDNTLCISARNKLMGRVSKITQGSINGNIHIDLGNGDTISSVITLASITQLSLKVGDEVCAIVKASDIMIGK